MSEANHRRWTINKSESGSGLWLLTRRAKRGWMRGGEKREEKTNHWGANSTERISDNLGGDLGGGGRGLVPSPYKKKNPFIIKKRPPLRNRRL